MKAFLLTVLVCLYINAVATYHPLRRGLQSRRPIRHMIFQGQVSRPGFRPIHRVRPMVRPIRMYGKYNSFSQRHSASLIHTLMKEKHYMKKKFLLKKSSYVPVKPFRNQHLRVLPGPIRRMGTMRAPRLQVPFQMTPTMPMMPRFPRILRERTRLNNQNMFNMRRPGIMGMTRNQFSFQEVNDDFRDFDDGRSDDRMEIFDDLDDIDDTFDSRFEDGFGSVGGFSRGSRSRTFDRGHVMPRSHFGNGFGQGVDSQVEFRGGNIMNNGRTEISFRNTHGPGTGVNLPGINRRPDFDDDDDDDFKPLNPDLVEDAMEDRKEKREDIREELKRDDDFPKVEVNDNEEKDLNIDDMHDDRVPALEDSVHSARNDFIEGFEMLGNRPMRGGSDINNIFRDNLFDLADDPFLQGRSGDDMDQSDDDRLLGTFALLGIDPGSLGPFLGDVGDIGARSVGSGSATRPQTTMTTERARVPWPLDFGFSNDENMNIVMNDVPPPSTL